MAKKPQFDQPICSCTLTFVMVILGLRVCSIVASCLQTVVETSVCIKLSKISTLPLQQLRFDVQIQWLLSLMICTNCSGTDFHFFPSFRAFVGRSPFCCGNCFFKRDWARLMASQFSQWPLTNSSRPSACYTPSKPLYRSSPSRQFACSTPSKSSCHSSSSSSKLPSHLPPLRPPCSSSLKASLCSALSSLPFGSASSPA